MIATMTDWVEIYKSSNRAHPFIIHVMDQMEFRDWDRYLQQYYMSSRLSSEGTKVAFQNSQWRNHGCGPEMCADGVVRLVSHPGEIWFKDNLDLTTPWVKVDIRRNAMKACRYQRLNVGSSRSVMYSNVETADLPRLKQPALPIDHEQFTLYTSPLPISKAKYDDLVSLSRYMAPEQASYYKDLMYDESIEDPDAEALECDHDRTCSDSESDIESDED